MPLTAEELTAHPEVQAFDLGMPSPSLFYRRAYAVPHDFPRQCLRVIRTWAPRHAPEKTYAQQRYGVPSAFVRIDCTVKGGLLRPYEVEDRPSGLGVLYYTNRQAFVRVRQILGTWEADSDYTGLTSVITPSRTTTHDDRGWGANLVHLPDLPDQNHLIIVRSNPYDFLPGGDWTGVYDQLAEQSLSSLIEEGNKSYGEGWLWTRVCTVEDLRDHGIDQDTAFVLKPRHGSKFQDAYGRPGLGVEIYHPARIKGSSTWSHTVKQLDLARDHGTGEPCTDQCGMYVQLYVPPIVREDALGTRDCMIRAFLAWDPVTSDWEYIGAVTSEMQDNVRLHGTSQTLFAGVKLMKPPKN